jgi:outer membrane protein assembly factor BamB
MTRYISTLCLVFFLYLGAQGQNWPQWRGPEGSGVAAPGNYPVKFSKKDGLLWKSELPGKGGSTPIVWNDRIFLTSGIGEDEEGEDGVLCYDWSGKLLWQVKLGKQSPGKHPRGSGSNPSIVTDGQRLFAYFKSGTVAALDFKGKILWKTNLQEKYGNVLLYWDLGTSPILANGNLVIAVMHGGPSYLVALDQASGKVAWKVDRNYTCSDESDHSYATPLLVNEGERNIIVVWGADHLTGHDAKTGEMIWECGGFNPADREYWRVIASPVISQGIAVVPYGRGKHLAGVKIGGTGDITKSARLWEKKGTSTDVATPVVIDGKTYIVDFKGNVWCLDIQTGNEIWEDEIPRGKGVFYSSPTLAGKKLYLIREEGTLYVCEISSSGLTILNETDFDDYFVATPVLVQDKILLRGDKYIYCIGK